MKNLVLRLIKLYQKYLSLDNGYPHKLFPGVRVCRYRPTCSEYCYEAIERYGIIKGSFLGLVRIIRCNPFSKGGFDPVK